MNESYIYWAEILEVILFIGVPLGVLVFFVVSLVNLCRTSRDDPKYKGRKTAFIVAAVLLAVLAAAVIGLMLLLVSAMNHM